MYILLYISRSDGLAVDVVEDAVEAALGDAGEVTGSGVGVEGLNLDIDVDPTKISIGTALDLVVQVLRELGLSGVSARVGWDADAPAP